MPVLTEPPVSAPTPASTTAEPADGMTDADAMQDWKGMDGAIAFHLIDRHANDWDDAGQMMNAWLRANTTDAADGLHSCSWHCDRPGCIRAQRDELRDKVAELEKDAARYRWLRDGCCDKDSVATRIAQNEYGMHWDAAIDAARS